VRKYFRVKNFEKLQNYKDRSPPWIRLYNDILEDYEFGTMPDSSKAHLMLIWLLASRIGNRLPLDEKWIGAKIQSSEKVDLRELFKRDFLEEIVEENQCDSNAPSEEQEPASKLQASCKQDACLETERETEERREEKSIVELPTVALAEVKQDLAEEVFAYWQEKCGHPKSKLDKTRRKAIEARIAEGYSIERIKQAIRGINFSPHNMGKNDTGTVFDDIELICRTGANVDRFAEKEEANGKARERPQASENFKQRASGIASFIELRKAQRGDLREGDGESAYAVQGAGNSS
jgi:hypothetical protein